MYIKCDTVSHRCLGRRYIHISLENDNPIWDKTAAQFTIARKLNQSRSLSTGERITKVLYIYTMELYSSLSKDEICRKNA